MSMPFISCRHPNTGPMPGVGQSLGRLSVGQLLLVVILSILLITSVQSAPSKSDADGKSCEEQCQGVKCPRAMTEEDCIERNGQFVDSKESDECLCCDQCLVFRNEKDSCKPSKNPFIQVKCRDGLVCADNNVCVTSSNIEDTQRKQREEEKRRRIKAIECDCEEIECDDQQTANECDDRDGQIVKKLTETKECQCCDVCRVIRVVNESCMPSKLQSIQIKCADDLICNPLKNYVCFERPSRSSASSGPSSSASSTTPNLINRFKISMKNEKNKEDKEATPSQTQNQNQGQNQHTFHLPGVETADSSEGNKKKSSSLLSPEQLITGLLMPNRKMSPKSLGSDDPESNSEDQEEDNKEKDDDGQSEKEEAADEKRSDDKDGD